MSSWNRKEFDTFAAAEELRISTQRNDGSWRPAVRIWVVRVGDALYVRAYRGTATAWYRHALRTARARIDGGGIRRDVTVERPTHIDDGTVSAAYRTKYARYSDTYVGPMVSDTAAATTLRLRPSKRQDEKGTT